MRNDPFNLERFVAAQRPVYDQALAEIRAGHKRSHWMWFIFPQIRGLGVSAAAEKYAIQSRREAEAYRSHQILGPRLEEVTTAMLSLQNVTLVHILGQPDDLKFRSSMTLFAACSDDGSVFHQALLRYCDGLHDEKTLAILRAMAI